MENEIKKENEMKEETKTEQAVVEVKKEEIAEVKEVVETKAVVEAKEADGTKLPQEIQEALANAEKSEEIKPKVEIPNLFVSEDETIDVGIDVIFNSHSAEVLSVVVAELEIDVEQVKLIFGHKRYNFIFTRPTYDKLNKYRQRATEFNSEEKINIVNQLKMRDYFIVYHLKEWDVEDEKGNAIELKLEPNGALTDETIDIVYGLHPSILDVVITSFERKMLLIG